MSDDLKTEVLITAREDGVEAAVTNVKRTLKSMGDAAQQAGAQASNGLGKIGSEGDNAARKIEASTRNMIANVEQCLGVYGPVLERGKEFVVTALHPGVTREQVVAATGWAVRFAEQVQQTAEPTAVELAALRDLEARTAAAHGQAPGEA